MKLSKLGSVELLDALELSDKRKANTRTLSGGMKRRLLIGKALVHEPKVLFLDEPTAGVDVELRRGLWRYVRTLRNGVPRWCSPRHYLEEAEELADWIGVIDQGRLLLVEEKDTLMRRHGAKTLRLVPGRRLQVRARCCSRRWGVPGGRRWSHLAGGPGRRGLRAVPLGGGGAGVVVKDLETRRTTLEDIFVRLLSVEKGEGVPRGRARDSRGLRTLFEKEVRRFLGCRADRALAGGDHHPLLPGLRLLAGGEAARGGRGPAMRDIVPGLVTLGVVTNAYLNSASSLFVMRSRGDGGPPRPAAHLRRGAGRLRGGGGGARPPGGARDVGGGRVLRHVHGGAPAARHLAPRPRRGELRGAGVHDGGLGGLSFEQIDFFPTFIITCPHLPGRGLLFGCRCSPPALRRLTPREPGFYLVDGVRSRGPGISDASPGPGPFCSPRCPSRR